MDDRAIIALISVVVAALGVGFGIYKHFTTRKVARVIYEVSQLADYAVPESFLHGIPQALVVVKVESAGNKLAENIVLRIRTVSDITDADVEPDEYALAQTEREIKGVVDRLNPGQRFRILLYCDGNPVENQIDELELTHSEGVGIDRRSAAFTTAEISVFGVRVAYDLLKNSASLLRIGPVKFK